MRFRQGNEQLHDLVEDRVPDEAPVPFLCECAAAECFATVEVTLGEWEDVASRANEFLMVAGHQRSEGEEVVGSLRGYEIARKPD